MRKEGHVRNPLPRTPPGYGPAAYGWHFKKYLKDFILKHKIKHVEFVKSISHTEAETFILSRSVIQAIANYTRDHGILEDKAWEFTGDLGSFENPPNL